MSFRNYLTGTVFVILCIWGPVDYIWPSWLLAPIGYLILVPLIVWLLLSWIWRRWEPSLKFESILNRVLSGGICLSLIVLAYIESNATTHIGNTQTIRTGDGYEDVGDYIQLPGPDYGNVVIIVVIALLFFWAGVLKKGAKSSDY